MIPTMIVFGLVLGRWWRAALIAASVFWPALLLWNGTLQAGPEGQSLVAAVLLSAALAVANAAVGVGIHQLVLAVFRRFRKPPSAVVSGG